MAIFLAMDCRTLVRTLRVLAYQIESIEAEIQE